MNKKRYTKKELIEEYVLGAYVVSGLSGMVVFMFLTGIYPFGFFVMFMAACTCVWVISRGVEIIYA